MYCFPNSPHRKSYRNSCKKTQTIDLTKDTANINFCFFTCNGVFFGRARIRFGILCSVTLHDPVPIMWGCRPQATHNHLPVPPTTCPNEEIQRRTPDPHRRYIPNPLPNSKFKKKIVFLNVVVRTNDVTTENDTSQADEDYESHYLFL